MNKKKSGIVMEREMKKRTHDDWTESHDKRFPVWLSSSDILP